MPKRQGHFAFIVLILLCATLVGTIRSVTVPASTNDRVFNVDEGDHIFAIQETVRVVRATWLSGIWLPPEQVLLQGETGIEGTRGSLYYWLQAGGQIVFGVTSGNPQSLFLARLVTLALHLTSVALTFLALRHLFPEQSQSALGGAAFLALVPTTSDLMSSVNTDAPTLLLGALTLALLSMVLRNWRRWPIWLALAPVLLAAYLIKGTAWPLLALPAVVVGLWLTLRWQMVVVGVVGVVALLALWLLPVFPNQGLSYWYYNRGSFEADPILAESATAAYTGNQALVVPAFAPGPVIQRIPAAELTTLPGQTVTLAGWVRADSPITSDGPHIVINGLPLPTSVTYSTDWTFWGVQAAIPSDTRDIVVQIPPTTTTIYVDGLILTVGAFPLARPPGSNQWDGLPYRNLLDNPSFEQTWPQFRDNLGAPYNLNYRLVALLDLPRTLPGWLALPRWWLTTYWASLNGVVSVTTRLEMLFPYALTGLAVLGLIVQGVARARQLGSGNLPQWWRGLALLLAFCALYVALLILRADLLPTAQPPLIWSAIRHAAAAFPAIAGLFGLGLMGQVPPRWRSYLLVGLVAGLVVFNLYIFFATQVPYYACINADPSASCIVLPR